MIKTLLKYVGHYRRASILTPVFTALEVVMDVLIPYVTAMLIDKGINSGDMQQVYIYGAMMIGMAFLSLLFGVLAGRFVSNASSGFAANLRAAMYSNIQRFSFSNIDKFSTAGLVTRMTTDVNNLQNAYSQLLRVSVRAPFRLVLSIFMCLVINPAMSLVFVVALCILATALTFIISRVTRYFILVFRQYDELNRNVQENISGIREVKAFVREEYEKDKFAKAAEKLYQLNVKAEKLMALNGPVMNLVVYGCIIALSWLGAHFIVSGTLTTGELTSLFTYVMSILMSLMMLSHIFVMLTMSQASGKRVAEVIEEEPDIRNPEEPLAKVDRGDIEFCNVDFSYQEGSGEYVIRDANFKIEEGETIGVIGGTGSGKSSLVALIDRLYDVNNGRVLVGGHDVRDYDLKVLRSAVSVVLQNNVLFSGTVMDNLRWGKADVTVEEAKNVCKIADADEFISQMADGYDTKIEQGGVNVSGGQRQRLCIARALLRNPKILILDDATSACDTATDGRIQKALKEHMPGVTKLIIAQRISSVKDCDRIMVMEGGRIIAFDTNVGLLKTCALYREIYDIQTDDDGDFDNWKA